MGPIRTDDFRQNVLGKLDRVGRGIAEGIHAVPDSKMASAWAAAQVGRPEGIVEQSAVALGICCALKLSLMLGPSGQQAELSAAPTAISDLITARFLPYVRLRLGPPIDSLSTAKAFLAERAPNSILEFGDHAVAMGEFNAPNFTEVSGWSVVAEIQPDQLRQPLLQTLQLLEDGIRLPDGARFTALGLEERGDKLKLKVFGRRPVVGADGFEARDLILREWMGGSDSVRLEAGVLRWDVPGHDSAIAQAHLNHLVEQIGPSGGPVSKTKLVSLAEESPKPTEEVISSPDCAHSKERVWLCDVRLFNWGEDGVEGSAEHEFQEALARARQLAGEDALLLPGGAQIRDLRICSFRGGSHVVSVYCSEEFAHHAELVRLVQGWVEGAGRPSEVTTEVVDGVERKVLRFKPDEPGTAAGS